MLKMRIEEVDGTGVAELSSKTPFHPNFKATVIHSLASEQVYIENFETLLDDMLALLSYGSEFVDCTVGNKEAPTHQIVFSYTKPDTNQQVG